MPPPGNFLRRLAQPLSPQWQSRLRRLWRGFREDPADVPHAVGQTGYAKRVQEEISRFADETVINDLPEIFHYWSNKFLRPTLESFGFSYPEDFFAVRMKKHMDAIGGPARMVSLGAGNCDTEVTIAKLLRERGVDRFTICCLDITHAMLERGRMLAQQEGLAEHFQFVEGDFNRWIPDGRYDIVMANQSLHHVSDLPNLFDAIAKAMGDHGIFITSDMIGRNGHQRWPEALAMVQEFWQELPREYRFNVQLRRQEDIFQDWDCSAEGFEGIHAQDILPLATRKFGFDFFYGYGNLIDPFVDRGFGPHFNAQADWDRDFIDRVHARDEREMLAGTIKPTHVLAVMRNERKAATEVWRHLTPEFCLRTP